MSTFFPCSSKFKVPQITANWLILNGVVSRSRSFVKRVLWLPASGPVRACTTGHRIPWVGRAARAVCRSQRWDVGVVWNPGYLQIYPSPLVNSCKCISILKKHTSILYPCWNCHLGTCPVSIPIENTQEAPVRNQPNYEPRNDPSCQCQNGTCVWTACLHSYGTQSDDIVGVTKNVAAQLHHVPWSSWSQGLGTAVQVEVLHFPPWCRVRQSRHSRASWLRKQHQTIRCSCWGTNPFAAVAW